jgi:hypothetical protein
MRRLLILWGIVGCLAVSTPALAQQGTSDLRGRVTDQQGAALPGATIVVRNEETGMFRDSISGPDGTFLLSAMSPGTYEISAELQGFRKNQLRGIRLEVGRTATIEVRLEVGTLAESVTVVGASPVVDITSKEIGGNVQAQELVDVPSFNRNFAGYLGMLPGVVTTISLTTFGADSISVSGQNVRNVNYTMDGSNNNDTFNGGNGGAQARVPVEAVQEFQLLTSQFDAEYGLASGGVVNSVSKQGTNIFHGSAFSFFQDERLTVRDYFAERDDLEKPPTKQQQFGGTIGGPIVRDKAHFFFAVERVILDGGVTINIPTRPDLTRTGFENTRVWNTFVRGDHQLSPNHTWGIRWLRETSPQPVQLEDNYGTPARNEAETDVDWTLVGSLSSVFGSNKVNTFRVSAVSEDVFFGNPNFNSNGHDQKILLPTLNQLSFTDQQSARANRRLDVAYGADNTFSWFVPNKAGDHDFKIGFNYLWSSLRVQDFGNMNATFTIPSDLAFDAANPRTYPERLSIRVPSAVDFLMKGHFIGVFAQDKWRPNGRLTLSLGARYDVEILPTPNQENPMFTDDPGGYPRDNNNVSPRLGFSYVLDSAGRSSVRGGYGIFFQRTSYTFLTNMFSAGRNSSSFTVQFPTNNADGGPRAGRFPTNPFLASGPFVNHDAIDALFPPGTVQRNIGTVRFDNPDREVAWARQYSVGYERELAANLALSVDYIRSEQRNQYTLKELNPGVRDTTTATSTLRRNNPLVGTPGEFLASVVTVTNDGFIDYDTFQVSLNKRYSQGYSARLSYAYSRGEGNTPTGQAETINSQFLDDLRLDTEIGPTNVDRPHILSINGTYDVPKTGGLKVSGVLQARSGQPFSLINTTFDNDRNGFTGNEYLPAGTYSGTGPDSITVENKGGRNGARGPNFMSIDMRAGYRFRLRGSRTLEAYLDVFNLTNEPNFANPTGDQRQPLFLVLQSIFNGGPTRTAQLQLRYAF